MTSVPARIAHGLIREHRMTGMLTRRHLRTQTDALVVVALARAEAHRLGLAVVLVRTDHDVTICSEPVGAGAA